MRELVNVLLQALPEQLKPLREDVRDVGQQVGRLGERTAKLEAAVIGNGNKSLQQQIDQVRADCEGCRQTLHGRITNLALDEKNPDPEVVESARMRERALGARWMGGSILALVLFLFELVRFVNWMRGRP